jgi:hypothetical protein
MTFQRHGVCSWHLPAECVDQATAKRKPLPAMPRGLAQTRFSSQKSKSAGLGRRHPNAWNPLLQEH